MSRIVGIDYAKGIAIIALLISHTLAGGGVRIYISSWNMPIFFVCGILQYLRYPQGISFQKFSFWFQHRANQIFIPYFLFGFLYILFIQSLSFLSGEEFELKSGCLLLISMQGVVSLWFLPVFFFSELLYAFGVAKLSRPWQICVMLLIIAVLVCLQYTGIPKSWLLRLMLKIMIALAFVISGATIVARLLQLSYKLLYLVIGLIVVSFVGFYNGFVGIGALELGNVFIFFTTGVALSFLIIEIMHVLGKERTSTFWKLLALWGANSIVVLVTNNLLIEIFRLIEYRLFNDFFVTHGLLGGLLMTLILLVPEYILIRLAHGKWSQLFGKKRSKMF